MITQIATLDDRESRSISPENFTGEPGNGGKAETGTGSPHAEGLGQGWKISPSIDIAPSTTFTLAEMEGPGQIEHFWITLFDPGQWRHSILRIYWDDQEHPSVECPLGDFFASGWDTYCQISSLAVCVNPWRGMNCYWPMPFRKHCRITLENLHHETTRVYYQVNYSLGNVPDESAYFHAQFRRVNPLPYKEVYTLLDGVEGHGHYAGTYLAWGVNNNSWWGEGEIKFYMDGDKDFPTICGTGTEDYFCGSHNFENQDEKQYAEYCTPYAGLPQVIRPDGVYNAQTRFGMYRWHITDPIRFRKKLRVTIQALGWRGDKRYLPLQDDIASTVFWYQTLPGAPFPSLPDRDALEII